MRGGCDDNYCDDDGDYVDDYKLMMVMRMMIYNEYWPVRGGCDDNYCDDDGDYDDDYKLMMVMRMMITMSTGR